MPRTKQLFSNPGISTGVKHLHAKSLHLRHLQNSFLCCPGCIFSHLLIVNGNSTESIFELDRFVMVTSTFLSLQLYKVIIKEETIKANTLIIDIHQIL